jgi:hypothetical protein
VPTTDNNGNQLRHANNDEQWHILTDLQEMEHTIIQHNIKHFGHATNTPLNLKQLTDKVGLDGDFEATENLLQGILPEISDFHLKVQLILNKISKNPQPTIDTTISTNDLTSLFKNVKESTSTFPYDAISDTGMP